MSPSIRLGHDGAVITTADGDRVIPYDAYPDRFRFTLSEDGEIIPASDVVDFCYLWTIPSDAWRRKMRMR